MIKIVRRSGYTLIELLMAMSLFAAIAPQVARAAAAA